jgi:Zinc knuckle
LQEPPLPNEDSIKFEIKKWEISYAKYIKDVDKLEADKLKVFGLMVGQIPENSKNRIKETDTGAIAMEQQDPRLLLSAILSTHLTDNRLGAEHNLNKIEQAFSKYVMEPGDSLAFYYQRFRALLSGVQEAYTRAKLEPPDTSYRDVQLALRFTIGLNSTYTPYKEYYEDGLKDLTESLVDAYSEASKFRPRTAGSGNPGDIGRANAFAMRGRGRGRGRGRSGRTSEIRSGAYGESAGSTSGGPSEYGTRKGACHTCGESGHYSFECKANESGNNAKGGTNTVHSDSSGRSKGK